MRQLSALVFLLAGLAGASARPRDCPDWNGPSPACGKWRAALRADSVPFCDTLLLRLSPNRLEPDLLSNISLCLAEIAAINKIAGYRNRLLEILSEREIVFFNMMKNARLERHMERSKRLANLGEFLFPNSDLILRETVETRILHSDYLGAGLSLLLGLKNAPGNAPAFKIQLDRILRMAQTEQPPEELLDSLLILFKEHTVETFSLLEELCWSHNNYTGAFQSILGTIALQRPDWDFLEHRIGRFVKAEAAELAVVLLENYPWREAAPEVRAMGLHYYLTLHSRLENWEILLKYYYSHIDEKFSQDAALLFAQSLLRAQNVSPDVRIENLKEAKKLLARLAHAQTGDLSRNIFLLDIEARILSGEFDMAKKKILNEKNNPKRSQSSGALHFWHAMVFLFENQWKAADSLLVLAGAYTDHPFSKRALEIRQWVILDTAAGALDNLLRGIAESPEIHRNKIKLLHKIPETSALWPHAQFELAQRYYETARLDSALMVLSHISQKAQEPWVMAKAKAQQTFYSEPRQGSDQSIEIYGSILLKYQQGVIAEFSRERIKTLKRKPQP